MIQIEATDRLGADATLLSDVCRALRVRMLVLFGSRATGSPPPAPGSDLDVAISLADGEDRPRFWQIHQALADAFPDQSIDLAFLNEADSLFRWEILRDGILLWGDPDDFLELRAFAFRDYVDSADLRALERKLFKKKMALIRGLLDAAA